MITEILDIHQNDNINIPIKTFYYILTKHIVHTIFNDFISKDAE
jgi:hypothetical protein